MTGAMAIEQDGYHFWKEAWDLLSGAATIAASILFGAFKLGEKMNGITERLGTLEKHIQGIDEAITDIRSEVKGIGILNARMDSLEKRVERCENKHEVLRKYDAVD